ncbi:MAG: regulatory protein RecX, partial [Chloroflexi bacterium]|nr:regulatory protein RecX [Chloroflexota bacterium]
MPGLGSPRRDPAEPPDASAAMETAIRFLATRPRTRWELDRRLRRAGVGEPDIEATLSRLAELGYVDDAAFARWWAEQRDRHAPRGRRAIEVELRQHGVERDVIEAYRVEHVHP